MFMRRARIGNDTPALDRLVSSANRWVSFANGFVAFPGSKFYSDLISSALARRTRRYRDGIVRASANRITAWTEDAAQITDIAYGAAVRSAISASEAPVSVPQWRKRIRETLLIVVDDTIWLADEYRMPYLDISTADELILRDLFPLMEVSVADELILRDLFPLMEVNVADELILRDLFPLMEVSVADELRLVDLFYKQEVFVADELRLQDLWYGPHVVNVADELRLQDLWYHGPLIADVFDGIILTDAWYHGPLVTSVSDELRLLDVWYHGPIVASVADELVLVDAWYHGPIIASVSDELRFLDVPPTLPWRLGVFDELIIKDVATQPPLNVLRAEELFINDSAETFLPLVMSKAETLRISDDPEAYMDLKVSRATEITMASALTRAAVSALKASPFEVLRPSSAVVSTSIVSMGKTANKSESIRMSTESTAIIYDFVNGGFESSLGSEWVEDGADISRSDVYMHSGSYGLYAITNTGLSANGGFKQTIATPRNTSFKVSLWSMILTDIDYSYGVFYVYVYDASTPTPNLLLNSGAIWLSDSDIWQEYISSTFTTPNNSNGDAITVKIYIYKEGSTQTVHRFDDFRLISG